MLSFDDYYYFYLVVKHGGFSAASEAEQISKSKLSRRILEIENRFNISLIQRTTRHFKVTALGQEFYEECAKVIAQVECAQSVLLQQRSEPKGLIRISCPVLMMHFQIRPLINQFLKNYPKVEIELALSSRRIDVLGDNIDIAIRTNFVPTLDSSLVVRDVVKTNHCLVATPEVLKGIKIERFEQLLDFPSIGLGMQQSEHYWSFKHVVTGESANILFKPRIRSNDMAGVYYAACDGLGIADLPYLSVEKDIREGRLIHILPNWQSKEGIVQLVYASRKGQRLVVERLIETLVEGLRDLAQTHSGYRTL